MTQRHENAISRKDSLKMRCEATAVSTSPRLYHNFFMQKIADCKNLLPPPYNYPYNTIVFLRNTAHSAHKNHEFCAKNSLSTLNKTLKSSENCRSAAHCLPSFALLALPQTGNTPELAEIVAVRCAAYRVLPCSHFCTLRYQKPSKLAQVGMCPERRGDTVARFRAGLNHISNLPPHVCGRKSRIKRSLI